MSAGKPLADAAPPDDLSGHDICINIVLQHVLPESARRTYHDMIEQVSRSETPFRTCVQYGRSSNEMGQKFVDDIMEAIQQVICILVV